PRLVARIGAAQGSRAPAALARLPAVVARAAPLVGPQPPASEPASRTYRGSVHGALFALLFVDAAVTALQIAFAHPALDTLGLLVVLVALGLVVAAAARQRAPGVPRALRNLVWITLAYLVVMVYAGAAMGTYYGIQT